MTWAIFDDAHTQAIGEIVRAGSDRVTAVVGGALLDDTLRRTLSERLRDDKETTKKLLKVGGPLGNTEPKVDILYQLHAFEKSVRNALYGITRVRNVFAHKLDASFELNLKSMNDAMALMKLHEGKTVYPHFILTEYSQTPIETISTRRDVFLINLKLCLLELMRDRVHHKTWTNIPLAADELNERRKKFEERERIKVAYATSSTT